MNVKNVVKLLGITLTFDYMKEDILERNRISAYNVADPSADRVPLRDISLFMLWKTLISVNNIYFLYPCFLQMHERTYTSTKPSACEQCDKMLILIHIKHT